MTRDDWNIFKELERIFNNVQRRSSSIFETTDATRSDINIRIEEFDKDIDVTVDLPQFSSDDIQAVTVDGQTLHVKAAKEAESLISRLGEQDSPEKIGWRVVLPSPVNASESEATFNNGILTITLPKDEKADGKYSIVN